MIESPESSVKFKNLRSVAIFSYKYGHIEQIMKHKTEADLCEKGTYYMEFTLYVR